MRGKASRRSSTSVSRTGRVSSVPLELGTIRLHWLNGGAFRMDGAAVFGQMPRPVWSTLLAPDEDNRVGLAARVMLVETGDEFGLVEAGLPHALTARQRSALFVE